ncbi:MAG: patatin-like phospholipase family protein [Proteobacteria bacterium]|nr:patatin-like phospholipase family protein [Pseudomonadota bacterium]MBU1639396.1 patatin-like phospholipase family protein [Pseudomonadota bacterium]
MLTACAHYAENVPLHTYQPDSGYMYPAPLETQEQDKLFIALAFSGGGTRAAALSYGVLKELNATPLPGNPGFTLLDEVDLISSVSGGSFTAAYYGLFHKEIFKDFESRFLHRDIQGELMRKLYNPVNWFKLASPYYSRIDLAQELYDKTVFNSAVFENLVQEGRHPFIALNATNMTTGAQFTFTQPQFDIVGSDLGQFTVGRAVAASSAFPFLLSPVSLLNHPSPDQYALPLDVVNGLKDFGINNRRYFWALNRAEYQNNKAGHPYIHLMDGGLSDNLGLRYIIDEYECASGLLFQRKAAMQHLVVIVVNAKTQPLESLDRHEKPPGLMDVAYKTATVSMDNYSFETVQAAKELLSNSIKAGQNVAACQKILDTHGSDGYRIPETGHNFDVHFIELNFLQVKDAALRKKLLALPTNFSLKPKEVQLLIDTGKSLLGESHEFEDLLQTLSQNHEGK